MGLLEAFERCVAEHVEPFEAGAIAEMETGDGIGDTAAIVAPAEIDQLLDQRCLNLRLETPPSGELTGSKWRMAGAIQHSET